MASWIATGHAAAFIVVLTLFEAVGLAVYHRQTGRGLMPAGFLPNMLAGDFLLLAWIASAHAAPGPMRRRRCWRRYCAMGLIFCSAGGEVSHVYILTYCYCRQICGFESIYRVQQRSWWELGAKNFWIFGIGFAGFETGA